VRDAFAAWKQGLPAVVLVHEPFATLARAQCQALGARDPAILIYKQDAPALESEAESTDKAQRVAQQLVELLSRPRDAAAR
jgi:hypothetical protein